MTEARVYSDIYSADFTVYEPQWERISEVIPKLEAHQLFPYAFSSPIFMMWEMTGRCPLRCRHCYNSSPKTIDELTSEEAMDLAHQIAEARPFSICLTGGEPTLRKDYLDIARYLRDHRVPTSTVTSGWLVEEPLAERMCDVFDYIQVSLDGPDSETHDRVRGRAGAFERALRAIKLFRKYGISRLAVAYSCMVDNIEAFPRIIDLCLDLNVDELRVQNIMMAGKAVTSADIEADDAAQRKVQKVIRDAAQRLQREGKGLSVMWGDPLVHITVGRTTGRVLILRVTAEGHFAISPYLPFVLGNARTMRLQDAWDAGMRRGWELEPVRQWIKDIDTCADLRRANLALGDGYIQMKPALAPAGGVQ